MANSDNDTENDTTKKDAIAVALRYEPDSEYAPKVVAGGRGSVAEQILEIATSGGAKVLGRDDIGSIAPNKAADIVLMDWDQLPYAGGKNDPVACIVMSGDSRLVHTVMVNGQIVVADGKLISIDERTVTHQINQVGKNLLQTASERIPSLKMDL